jgi:hypothetical protein
MPNFRRGWSKTPLPNSRYNQIKKNNKGTDISKTFSPTEKTKAEAKKKTERRSTQGGGFNETGKR